MYFKRNPVILDPEMQLCATAFNSKKKLTRSFLPFMPMGSTMVPFSKYELPAFQEPCFSWQEGTWRF
jgi:hypothetical protein